MIKFWSANRGLLAVILSLLTGFMTVAFVDICGHWLYPPDGLLDPEDPSTYQHYLDSAPLGALIFIVLAQVLGMFIVAYVSTKVAPVGNNIPFIISSILFILAMIANFVMLPFHPLWVMMASFIGAATAAYFGRDIAVRSTVTDDAET